MRKSKKQPKCNNLIGGKKKRGEIRGYTPNEFGEKKKRGEIRGYIPCNEFGEVERPRGGSGVIQTSQIARNLITKTHFTKKTWENYVNNIYPYDKEKVDMLNSHDVVTNVSKDAVETDPEKIIKEFNDITNMMNINFEEYNRDINERRMNERLDDIVKIIKDYKSEKLKNGSQTLDKVNDENILNVDSLFDNVTKIIAKLKAENEDSMKNNKIKDLSSTEQEPKSRTFTFDSFPIETKTEKVPSKAIEKHRINLEELYFICTVKSDGKSDGKLNNYKSCKVDKKCIKEFMKLSKLNPEYFDSGLEDVLKSLRTTVSDFPEYIKVGGYKFKYFLANENKGNKTVLKLGISIKDLLYKSFICNTVDNNTPKTFSRKFDFRIDPLLNKSSKLDLAILHGSTIWSKFNIKPSSKRENKISLFMDNNSEVKQLKKLDKFVYSFDKSSGTEDDNVVYNNMNKFIIKIF